MKRKFIVIILVVLIVLLGGVILFFVNSGKSEEVVKQETTEIMVEETEEIEGTGEIEETEETEGTEEIEGTEETEDVTVSSWRMDKIEGKIITDSHMSTSEKFIEKHVFATHKDWVAALEDTDISKMKEQESAYDAEFFENKSLCYIATTTSAGKQFQLDAATLQEVDGEHVLTIHVSYSPEDGMLNSLGNYFFLVEFEKEYVSDVDDVKLEVLEK